MTTTRPLPPVPRLQRHHFGGVCGGREAQYRGLIDGIRSMDEVLADLARVPAKG